MEPRRPYRKPRVVDPTLSLGSTLVVPHVKVSDFEYLPVFAHVGQPTLLSFSSSHLVLSGVGGPRACGEEGLPVGRRDTWTQEREEVPQVE